jgi:hypothetical protein
VPADFAPAVVVTDPDAPDLEAAVVVLFEPPVGGVVALAPGAQEALVGTVTPTVSQSWMAKLMVAVLRERC